MQSEGYPYDYPCIKGAPMRLTVEAGPVTEEENHRLQALNSSHLCHHQFVNQFRLLHNTIRPQILVMIEVPGKDLP